MHVSSIPTNQIAITTVATRWLSAILDDSHLSGTSLPTEIRGYIYINGIPRLIMYGTWQLAEDVIYLPRSGSELEPFSRLAILAAIASLTRANTNAALVEKLTARLTTVIAESVKRVYGAIVSSVQHPNKLAIDQENYRAAAEINGTWLLPNGVPVEVTDKWITMDF